jgi:hypothetical protein|tara:strand:- start:772 stop:1005 length:234 start_codon:yes stop_codon:yes gene_type:complete
VLETLGWLYLGIMAGFVSAVVIIGMLRAGKQEDLEMEIQDLRTQRTLLKEEIFRLTSPPSKRPRRKRTKRPTQKRPN